MSTALPLMPFLLWSGYLPILLFSPFWGGRALLFIRANATFALPPTRPRSLTFFLGGPLLEIGGNLTALLVSFAVFYCIGEMEVPKDLPMFYLGYFYMIWVVRRGSDDHRRTQRAIGMGGKRSGSPIPTLYLIVLGFLFISRTGCRSDLRNAALYTSPTHKHTRSSAEVSSVRRSGPTVTRCIRRSRLGDFDGVWVYG